MQQPQNPNPSKPEPDPATNPRSKMKMPTPQELITHYESQGMEPHQASLKAIEDLQRLLFRVVTSGKGKKDISMSEASRKLDTVNARLSVLDMKLDSKPGYPQTFAIGVASGAAFRGVVGVWPRVLGGLMGLWDSVRGVSDGGNH